MHINWFSSNFEISNEVFEIHSKPVYTNEICYSIKFGIPNSMELSIFPSKVVSMKSKSHTQVSFLTKIHKKAQSETSETTASGTIRKDILDQI